MNAHHAFGREQRQALLFFAGTHEPGTEALRTYMHCKSVFC